MEDSLEKQTIKFRFATFFSLMSGAEKLVPDFRIVVSWRWEEGSS